MPSDLHKPILLKNTDSQHYIVNIYVHVDRHIIATCVQLDRAAADKHRERAASYRLQFLVKPGQEEDLLLYVAQPFGFNVFQVHKYPPLPSAFFFAFFVTEQSAMHPRRRDIVPYTVKVYNFTVHPPF